MKSILAKCESSDFEYLSKVLDSYAAFTNDSRRKELMLLSTTDDSAKEELIALVDKQIRYYGSSELAYFSRSLMKDDGGISSEELLDDVCAKLKVTVKKGGSVEARLERLATAIVEKELFSKTPEELAAAFKNIGVGNAKADLIFEHLKKNGKAAVLPVLVEVLGPKVALGIVETIVISLIAQIIGKEAAKHLVKELAKRNPWLNALGPVMWALSGAWLAFDLQGPAYRKTVPICLYLGVVSIRDGLEDQKPEVQSTPGDA